MSKWLTLPCCGPLLICSILLLLLLLLGHGRDCGPGQPRSRRCCCRWVGAVRPARSLARQQQVVPAERLALRPHLILLNYSAQMDSAAGRGGQLVSRAGRVAAAAAVHGRCQSKRGLANATSLMIVGLTCWIEGVMAAFGLQLVSAPKGERAPPHAARRCGGAAQARWNGNGGSTSRRRRRCAARAATRSTRRPQGTCFWLKTTPAPRT